MNLKNQMLAEVDLQVFPMENDACIVGIELIREIRVVKPVLSEKPKVALSDQPKAKTIDMGHDIVCEDYRNVIRDLQNSIEFCERIIGWLLPVRKPMTPVQADFAEAPQKLIINHVHKSFRLLCTVMPISCPNRDGVFSQTIMISSIRFTGFSLTSSLNSRINPHDSLVSYP
jgi:hypothetical protein